MLRKKCKDWIRVIFLLQEAADTDTEEKAAHNPAHDVWKLISIFMSYK